MFRTFRTELRRIYELRDLITDQDSPNAYFPNFEERLQESPHHVMQIYLDWERACGVSTMTLGDF